MAAISLIVSLVSLQPILSRPILFLFSFMVSWHVADIVVYVCGLQGVHSILMAANVFMVSIITTATIASRPISNFVGSMVSCCVVYISKYVWGV